MALDQQTEMTPTEIDEVLARHETGVLSLARNDEPYAIPISYGYDPDHRRFYMRLVSTPKSRKREFLSSSPSVRLVVYEEDDQIYRSVIADGSLEHVTMDEMTTERIVQYGQAKRPLFEIWGESKRDLDINLYELDADSLSGRRIELTGDNTA